MEYRLLFVLILGCLTAGAQRYSPFLPLPGDANYPGLFFRTGDGLYLRFTDDSLLRVTLHSDTREETGKDSIEHRFITGIADTVYAGSFTAPGLYVMRTDTVRRRKMDAGDESGYEYVHFEDIDLWQSSWFITYYFVSNGYKGLSWRIGSEKAHSQPVYSYFYCYGPGSSFPAAGSSVLDVPAVACGAVADTSIGVLTDSLNYAFDNINSDSLQTRLDSVAEDIAEKTDTLKTITFSLFLNTGEPVRVLVRDSDTMNSDTVEVRCRQAMQIMITLLNDSRNWKFSVKGSDGQPPARMFTSALSLKLSAVADQLFSICPSFYFPRTDATGTRQSLAAYAAGHINGNSGIYAGSVLRNGSRQWIMLYTITGKKPKPK